MASVLGDITANLKSLSFDAGLTEEEKYDFKQFFVYYSCLVSSFGCIWPCTPCTDLLEFCHAPPLAWPGQNSYENTLKQLAVPLQI